MGRAVRWGIAGALFLVLLVVWHTFVFGVAMLITVILGVVIGVMVAPDIAWFAASLFIGGIRGERDRFDRPPPEYGPARTLATQERWGEAIEAYRRILWLHPGDVKAQRAIAEIYLENLGDLENGMLEYNALLNLKLEDATRVTILMRLAELYDHRFNRPDYAEACLRDIIARYPDSKSAAGAAERLQRLGTGTGLPEN